MEHSDDDHDEAWLFVYGAGPDRPLADLLGTWRTQAYRDKRLNFDNEYYIELIDEVKKVLREDIQSLTEEQRGALTVLDREVRKQLSPQGTIDPEVLNIYLVHVYYLTAGTPPETPPKRKARGDDDESGSKRRR